MKSVTTSRFRICFKNLPENVKQSARKAYALWKNDSSHPGLQFKLVVPENAVYSVRISLSYRALGTKSDDTMVWFWIGSHTKYDELLKSF